jgi:hypothetical protein
MLAAPALTPAPRGAPPAAPALILHEREARSLLAVIHRDGGHHTERVGFAQSTADAIEIVYVMLAAMVADEEGDT